MQFHQTTFCWAIFPVLIFIGCSANKQADSPQENVNKAKNASQQQPEDKTRSEKSNIETIALKDLEKRTILINSYWPGATTAELESAIVTKCEKLIGSVSEIETVHSFMRQYYFSVSVCFAPRTDIKRAIREVKAELDQFPAFPQMMEPLEVMIQTEIPQANLSDIFIELEYPFKFSSAATVENWKQAAEDVEETIKSLAPESTVIWNQEGSSLTFFINDLKDPRQSESEIRKKLETFAGIGFYIENRSTPANKLVVTMNAPKRETLIPLNKKVRLHLKDLPTTYGFRISGIKYSPQVKMTPDKEKLEKLGIDLNSFYKVVLPNDALFHESKQITLPGVKDFEKLTVESKSGSKIPVKEICSIEMESVPSQLVRFNSKPATIFEWKLKQEKLPVDSEKKLIELAREIKKEVEGIEIDIVYVKAK